VLYIGVYLYKNLERHACTYLNTHTNAHTHKHTYVCIDTHAYISDIHTYSHTNSLSVSLIEMSIVVHVWFTSSWYMESMSCTKWYTVQTPAISILIAPAMLHALLKNICIGSLRVILHALKKIVHLNIKVDHRISWTMDIVELLYMAYRSSCKIRICIQRTNWTWKLRKVSPCNSYSATWPKSNNQ
jgi:Fe-S cluster assembly scaffold protein SufB